MPVTDIALVKRHLRISWDDEDAEIAAYQAAAEAIAFEYLGRHVVEEGSALEGNAIAITPPIVAAVLLITNDLFDARTSPEGDTGPPTLPPVVRSLLAPYRRWNTFEE